ncbi:MAG: N-acetylneuraminate synthase family protein [Deltaproteobacteria bacterium]|nr:N-acetylneuraminate synthase family protein [Deltaproteobacteria bacterium]
MIIDSHDTDQKVFIIAEIGSNHEGNFTLAEELIGLAAEAGADAVKFQTIVPERLISPKEKDRLTQLRKFQLSDSEFESLSRTARQEGVLFLSTPFDIESARFLNSLVPAFKIASGDNDFYPLLSFVVRLGKPILLSTGFLTMPEIIEIRRFVSKVYSADQLKSKMAFLHCVSSYPTLPHDANLLAIQSLLSLDLTIGYSDHTLGIEAPLLAVALGARVIEKHFTKDKNYSDFRDHCLSADPKEMKDLVQRIREVEILLGDGVKKMEEGEKGNLLKMRRSATAIRDLPAGRLLTREDIAWLRPGGGIPPKDEEKLLGRALRQPIARGEKIALNDLQESF